VEKEEEEEERFIQGQRSEWGRLWAPRYTGVGDEARPYHKSGGGGGGGGGKKVYSGGKFMKEVGGRFIDK